MIRFTARRQAPVLMLERHAEALMAQLGFPEEHWQAARGAWPEDRLPDLLARLEQCLVHEAAQEAARVADPDQASADQARVSDHEADVPLHQSDVRLAQRSWPLKRMIEAAIADNVPILWER
jgi:hypothetical protein